jgi:PIN domain nuclease of toxin-antitoxin system
LTGEFDPAISGRSYVLDSSAVIALLNGQPGGEVVAALLFTSVISTINWAEVISWLGSYRNLRGVQLEEAREVLDQQGLIPVPVSLAHAENAGLLAPQTRAAGLSIADRVALTLAMEFDCRC